MRTEDANDTELTLDNGQTLSGQDDYLVVETHNADEVWIYIDDGTSGSKPAQYDLTVETRKERSVQDWMFNSSFTGQTTRSYSIAAPSNKTRIDIENVSGSNGQNYRVYIESVISY